MSNTAAKAVLHPFPQAEPKASIGEIFCEFLIIGATSFGGVVPYLRGHLVGKCQWVDDKEFVEMLSISQSLPGLNATNMAILVGDKLGGALASLAAILGICLPGAAIMALVVSSTDSMVITPGPLPGCEGWRRLPWGLSCLPSSS
jgi:chromate transporter